MTRGFVAAGLVNVLGVLLVSRGLTGDAVGELYPEVFSRFGLVGIILWGLAYLAAAPRPTGVPALALVFAIGVAKLVETLSPAAADLLSGGRLGRDQIERPAARPLAQAH